MDFSAEYAVLQQLKPTVTYIARYQFNNEEIKWYIRFSPTVQYLILNVNFNNNDTLLHAYQIIKKGKAYRINGYLGKDFHVAKPLLDSQKTLNTFYSQLKAAIQSIPSNGTPDFDIQALDSVQVENKLRHQLPTQTLDDRIYFHYTRGAKSITPNQQRKINTNLGREALKYLLEHHLTAVFCSDPTKQRTLQFTLTL